MKNADYAKLILDVIPPTMRKIRTEMRQVAKGEVTVPQFRILVRLSHTPSTNWELAEWMGVSAPTMTRMIDPLVKRALVKRIQEASNRRKVQLSLTEEGLNAYQRIRGKVNEKLQFLLENLTEEKKNHLSVGLSVLNEIFTSQ